MMATKPAQKELVKVVIDGHVITATDEHPFWVETFRDWIDAEDLHHGDELLTDDGHTLASTAIRSTFPPSTT